MATLQQRLDEFKRTFASGAPSPQRPARSHRNHASRDGGAEGSGAEDLALTVGNRAPAFALMNQDDVQVASGDLLRGADYMIRPEPSDRVKFLRTLKS